MKKRIYGDINRRFAPGFIIIGVVACLAGVVTFYWLPLELLPMGWVACALGGLASLWGTILWIFADYI